MKLDWRYLAAAAAVTMLVLAGADGAHSDQIAPSKGAHGSILSMSRFYTGSVGTQGRFTGKAVCLRCDIHWGADPQKLCEKEGHRLALYMDSDAAVHPLLAGTPEVLDQLTSPDLRGKIVTVNGTYYPSTGAILVGGMTVQD